MSAKFSIDLWDQFEEVYRRVSVGKDFTTSLAAFVHKRAAIEREYAKNLQTLCKSTGEKGGDSVFAGWTAVREETENIAKKHAEFAEALAFQVEEPLQNFLKETKKSRQALCDQGRKVTKDVQTAEGKMLSAKASFEQARKKQDETKEEYERAAFTNQQSPHVEKLSKKMKLDAKKSSSLDKKYVEAVDACRQLQDKFFDDEMPTILAEFQNSEETRLERTKLVLQSYVELQRSISPEILSSCDRMGAVVKNINATNDLQNFIAEKRTNAPKPERAVYEAYNAELGRCVKAVDSSASVNSSAQRATAATATTAAAATSSSRNVQQASTPTQTRANPVARKGISKCRGLFDYKSDDPNELSFNQNDIITVLQKDPSGWWQGELNGRIGVFPSVDWVEELGDGGAASAPSRRQCRALYDYVADNEYELSIYQGDILTVDGDEEGWFSGSNQRGQYGRYPSNYVELL